MGFLKNLFYSKKSKLDKNQVSSSGKNPEFLPGRLKTIRKEMVSELKTIERSLLMKPGQEDEDIFKTDYDKPFDELEFIVKNNVTPSQYISSVKECISDLDDISTTEDEQESKELHRDELSRGVITMLQKQSAQVLLLSGDDGRVSTLAKEPVRFIQGVLLEADKKADGFDDVDTERDLSSIELDFNDYLLKSGSSHTKNAVRQADEAFNKDALRLQKSILKWDKKAEKAKGENKSEYEYKKMRAEKELSRSVSARKNAVQEAFRSGLITEYYYNQRTEQLEKGDFTKTPEMFEVDAIKNRSEYLKEHDLQDLSKTEADEILGLAKSKAEKNKKVFLAKEFLAKNGLASDKRYTMPEMGINNDSYFRTLARGKNVDPFKGDPENIAEPKQISVDLDEKDKEEVTYVFTGVRTEPIKNK